MACSVLHRVFSFLLNMLNAWHGVCYNTGMNETPTQEGGTMKVYRVYDNGGTTFDRYTVYFGGRGTVNHSNGLRLCVGMKPFAASDGFAACKL